MMNFLLAASVTAYLIGSIPTAYIMVKLIKGADVRTIGSGNVGATNVFRAAGPWAGAVTFALDGFKGWVATAMVPGWAGAVQAGGGDLAVICCFAAVVCGHNWPVFLNFKGGKGVAVSAGGLLGIAPEVFAGVLAVFGLVYAAWGWVSLGSIAAAAALPVFMFWLNPSAGLRYFSLALALLVIVKHRTNIKRLINGTEPKTGHK